MEATGFEVGKNSKWAKKQGGGCGKDKTDAGGRKGGGGNKGGGHEGGASGGLEGYSDQIRYSLQNVEEAQVGGVGLVIQFQKFNFRN